MCFGNHDDAHGGRRPRPQPNRPVELQPVRRDNRAHHNNNSNNHHNNRNPRSNTPTALPPRTSNDMSPAIRAEVLTATHQAFGQLAYGIIGGVALAEYGQARGTNDVDVMIPRDISEIAESTILSSARFTRTTGGGIGYTASDGRCYGIDITTDQAIGQVFRGVSETQTAPQVRGRQSTPARLMTIQFLLNSKAYSYLTRVGTDAAQKRAKDASDLIFIIDYMTQRRIRPDRKKCRWVVDYDFWTSFTATYQGTERLLAQLGLQRDATPSSENRSETSSRRSSNSGSASSHQRR